MGDVDVNGAAAFGGIECPYEQLVGHFFIATDRDNFFLRGVDERFQCAA